MFTTNQYFRSPVENDGKYFVAKRNPLGVNILPQESSEQMLFYLTYCFQCGGMPELKSTRQDASIALYCANIFDRMLAVSEVNSNQSIFSLMYRDEAFNGIINTTDVCIIIRVLLVQNVLYVSAVCRRREWIALIDNKHNVIKFYENSNYTRFIVQTTQWNWHWEWNGNSFANDTSCYRIHNNFEMASTIIRGFHQNKTLPPATRMMNGCKRRKCRSHVILWPPSVWKMCTQIEWNVWFCIIYDEKMTPETFVPKHFYRSAKYSKR